ncbi:hypothetical protein EDD21DRAFT_391683 [Dissophora ornata]|nr:hypothetical protein EDD21DRAFT_391683 [Dissophora ornata]
MAPPSAVSTTSTQRPETNIRTDNNNNNNITTQTPVWTLSSAQGQASTSSSSPPSPPFADRIRIAEHRFTSLTQNIAHFSPLKNQLDKHNVAIERLESEIKNKTVLLQSCQEKLKSIAKRPQNSRQASNISLNASEDREADILLAQQRATKETLDSLNGQLLAAKILVREGAITGCCCCCFFILISTLKYNFFYT